MGAKEVMSTADFETRKKAIDAGRLGKMAAKELHAKGIQSRITPAVQRLCVRRGMCMI